MTEPESANAVTLASYGLGMHRWRAASRGVVGGVQLAFLEQVLQALPKGAQVLEIGSGTGRDAAWLEAHGLQVRRTDGCPAFVAAMNESGAQAELLDVLHDPLPTGFDLVYASAVLLHLEAADLPLVLTKLSTSAPLVAFTVKVGEGSEWSTAKMDMPRFFQYWTEPTLRQVLAQTPWRVEAMERRGSPQEWLQVICRA